MKQLSAILLIGLTLWSCQSQKRVATASATTRSSGVVTNASTVAEEPALSPVCAALRSYPKAPYEKLSFEAGEISGLCRPFVKRPRSSLDLCGDSSSDPYVSKTSMPAQPAKPEASSSKFTFASRKEMYRRGKINLVSDPKYASLAALFDIRARKVRADAADLCCGSDTKCHSAMENVEVSLCKPLENGDGPDPCVFGGTYTMSGEGYSNIFGAIHRTYSTQEGAELREIASRNIGYYGGKRISADFSANPKVHDPMAGPAYPMTGKIVLTSYVSEKDGISTLIPTLNHELGHACSMIRMQLAAVGPNSLDKAKRAVQWLNQVKDRCDAQLKLPEAYTDFWESVGETKGLAQCLGRIAELNQKQQIDRTCEKLCPGHYLEESAGIAFAMLNGDLRGKVDSVFPNTCDHVRDGQHPMVSDVVDCLAQHSPRFRKRLADAYSCGTGTRPSEPLIPIASEGSRLATK